MSKSCFGETLVSFEFHLASHWYSFLVIPFLFNSSSLYGFVGQKVKSGNEVFDMWTYLSARNDKLDYKFLYILFEFYFGESPVPVFLSKYLSAKTDISNPNMTVHTVKMIRYCKWFSHWMYLAFLKESIQLQVVSDNVPIDECKIDCIQMRYTIQCE